MENKRVIELQKDITEVINAIMVYENLDNLDFKSQNSLLLARKLGITGLIEPS